jgi:hypothetical protein
MPLTPGVWRYQPAAGGGARCSAHRAPLLSLRCVRAGGQVILERAAPMEPGRISGWPPATITTTSMQRPRMPSRCPGSAAGHGLARAINLLDAMAFSRGRFMVDVTGLPS